MIQSIGNALSTVDNHKWQMGATMGAVVTIALTVVGALALAGIVLSIGTIGSACMIGGGGALALFFIALLIKTSCFSSKQYFETFDLTDSESSLVDSNAVKLTGNFDDLPVIATAEKRAQLLDDISDLIPGLYLAKQEIVSGLNDLYLLIESKTDGTIEVYEYRSSTGGMMRVQKQVGREEEGWANNIDLKPIPPDEAQQILTRLNQLKKYSIKSETKDGVSMSSI